MSTPGQGSFRKHSKLFLTQLQGAQQIPCRVVVVVVMMLLLLLLLLLRVFVCAAVDWSS